MPCLSPQCAITRDSTETDGFSLPVGETLRLVVTDGRSSIVTRWVAFSAALTPPTRHSDVDVLLACCAVLEVSAPCRLAPWRPSMPTHTRSNYTAEKIVIAIDIAPTRRRCALYFIGHNVSGLQYDMSVVYVM